ncbi:MAG: phosphohistidine phosphatase SixA [Desulfobulbaceae bacterium]|nr:phosphohistidine phosphatase SixA [Desulfobulbaceae bacterium]
MNLYLVQHGLSLSKDQDPECGLSGQGKEIVELIADSARSHGVKIRAIRHSEKKRARETAEIFNKHFTPAGGISEQSGLKPLDDVTSIADSLTNAEDIMLVGHLPFMERLAAFLITGSQDKPVVKFQNGGIVCLEKDSETGDWYVKWTMLPHIK